MCPPPHFFHFCFCGTNYFLLMLYFNHEFLPLGFRNTNTVMSTLSAPPPTFGPHTLHVGVQATAFIDLAAVLLSVFLSIPSF